MNLKKRVATFINRLPFGIWVFLPKWLKSYSFFNSEAE